MLSELRRKFAYAFRGFGSWASGSTSTPSTRLKFSALSQEDRVLLADTLTRRYGIAGAA